MKRVLITFFTLILLGLEMLYFSLPAHICKANTLLSNVGVATQDASDSREPRSVERLERQSFLLAVGAQRDEDIRQLEVGKSIEREIARGEVHTYEVSVSSGQYVYVFVDERTVNIGARLFGPDGKLLIEVDTSSGVDEHVTLVAETSGTYRLEINARGKESPKGRYVVSLKDLRDATPRDRVRVLAEQTFLEAQAITLKEETGESYQASLHKYEEARDLFQEVGAYDRVLLSLLRIGNNYGTLTQYQKALDFFGQALKLSRSLGDRKREAVLLGNLGAMYNELGEQQRAVEIFFQLLPLEKELGVTSRLTFINLGIANIQMGEYQKALEAFNKSQALANSAKVICAIGTTYLYMGDYQTALEFLKQALETSRKSPDPYTEAESLMNIGTTYMAMGEHKSALEAFNKALPLHRKFQDGAYEANTLLFIGQILQSGLQYRAALDNYSQALALARAGGYLKQEAEILPNVGEAYKLLGEREKASESYNKALHLTAIDPDGEIKAHYGLASLALEEGRLQEARIRIESAIKVIESIRGNLASPQLRASFFATKQQPYLFYINLLMQLYKQAPAEGFDAQAFQTSEKVHARSLLELLPEARANVTAGADPQLLAQERRLLQLLNGKAERQSRLLNDKDTLEQAEEVKRDIERIMADLQGTQASIRGSSPHFAALTQPQPLSLKEIQQQVLDLETLLLEYSLGDDHSYLWVVGQTSLNSFALPKRADVETAARRVYDLLTASNQVIKGETPEQRQSRLARAEKDYAEASAALSKMVIAPAAAMLGQKRLVIVADGALQYIPFAALPEPSDKAQPLIARHEVIHLPSASALAVLRHELAGRKPAAKAVAVLADPVFSRDDPRLKTGVKTLKAPDSEQSESRALERAIKDTGHSGEGLSIPRLLYSRREAEAIVGGVAAGDAMKAVDFDASRATAMRSDMNQFRIVHFATHGLLNSQHPELSGIVLSLVNRQGEPQNGFLRLHDLFNLKLSADLVTMSACQTALGKEIRGEGLIGLTRGFMYAGAARVMASLWKVDDAATAELMKRFYGKVFSAKMRPAAALREAQLEMWQNKRWRSPYNWAAFTLQGEWR